MVSPSLKTRSPVQSPSEPTAEISHTCKYKYPLGKDGRSELCRYIYFIVPSTRRLGERKQTKKKNICTKYDFMDILNNLNRNTILTKIDI